MRLYCVVYRTDGTENFRWHRSIPQNKEECLKTLDNVRRQGYACHMEDHSFSMAIGLPETYGE